MRSASSRRSSIRSSPATHDDKAFAVLSSTQLLPIDENGRVRLPDDLIAHAGLKDRVSFVGLGRKFQIWDAERFARHRARRSMARVKARCAKSRRRRCERRPRSRAARTKCSRCSRPRDGAHYVDGTFGGGGYARAILEAADCRVLGIDRDPDAIARGQRLALHYDGRLTLVQGGFSRHGTLLADAGDEQTDGVVLDLGVSSFQFDQAERGFSFRARRSARHAHEPAKAKAPPTSSTRRTKRRSRASSRAWRRAFRAPRRPRHHRRASLSRTGAAGRGRRERAGPRRAAPAHPSRHAHLPGAAHPCE